MSTGGQTWKWRLHSSPNQVGSRPYLPKATRGGPQSRPPPPAARSWRRHWAHWSPRRPRDHEPAPRLSPPALSPLRRKNIGSPNVQPTMGRPVVGYLPPIRLVAPHPSRLPPTLWSLRSALGRQVSAQMRRAGEHGGASRQARVLAPAVSGARLPGPGRTPCWGHRSRRQPVTADTASAKRGWSVARGGLLLCRSIDCRAWFVMRSTPLRRRADLLSAPRGRHRLLATPCAHVTHE